MDNDKLFERVINESMDFATIENNKLFADQLSDIISHIINMRNNDFSDTDILNSVQTLLTLLRGLKLASISQIETNSLLHNQTANSRAD